MDNKVKLTGIILIAVGVLILSYVRVQEMLLQRPSTEQIIDSLSRKIDSIKVENITLIQQNDSIQVKIVEVEKNYEKTIDTILTNDVSDDYIFFTNYVDRFSNSNYSQTTEDN